MLIQQQEQARRGELDLPDFAEWVGRVRGGGREKPVITDRRCWTSSPTIKAYRS